MAGAQITKVVIMQRSLLAGCSNPFHPLDNPFELHLRNSYFLSLSCWVSNESHDMLISESLDIVTFSRGSCVEINAHQQTFATNMMSLGPVS